MIYLDNHSTTPVDKRVLKKMLPYFSIKYNNPHSQVTSHNKNIIKEINIARSNIAKSIGAEKDEIIFTSGATESNNLAIKGSNNNSLYTCHTLVLGFRNLTDAMYFKINLN